jgi:hypothetical protein
MRTVAALVACLLLLVATVAAADTMSAPDVVQILVELSFTVPAGLTEAFAVHLSAMDTWDNVAGRPIGSPSWMVTGDPLQYIAMFRITDHGWWLPLEAFGDDGGNSALTTSLSYLGTVLYPGEYDTQKSSYHRERKDGAASEQWPTGSPRVLNLTPDSGSSIRVVDAPAPSTLVLLGSSVVPLAVYAWLRRRRRQT